MFLCCKNAFLLQEQQNGERDGGYSTKTGTVEQGQPAVRNSGEQSIEAISTSTESKLSEFSHTREAHAMLENLWQEATEEGLLGENNHGNQAH